MPLAAIFHSQTKTAKTQLIAHDKEVYDISFSKSKDVFATVGADGSLRMFDLRCVVFTCVFREGGPGGSALLYAYAAQILHATCVYVALLVNDVAGGFLCAIVSFCAGLVALCA